MLQQKGKKEIKVKAKKKGKGHLTHPVHSPASLLNQKMK